MIAGNEKINLAKYECLSLIYHSVAASFHLDRRIWSFYLAHISAVQTVYQTIRLYL